MEILQIERERKVRQKFKEMLHDTMMNLLKLGSYSAGLYKKIKILSKEVK